MGCKLHNLGQFNHVTCYISRKHHHHLKYCISNKIKIMPQQYMERKKKKRPQDTSVSKAVTDIQSYLFIHMILAGPFFLGPLRCYFHGLGKKTKSPSLNHIQPTEHTSITQKPGFTTAFLLRFDPSSVKSERKGLWKLS